MGSFYYFIGTILSEDFAMQFALITPLTEVRGYTLDE
jgi:hypothetical protein